MDLLTYASAASRRPQVYFLIDDITKARPCFPPDTLVSSEPQLISTPNLQRNHLDQEPYYYLFKFRRQSTEQNDLVQANPFESDSNRQPQDSYCRVPWSDRSPALYQLSYRRVLYEGRDKHMTSTRDVSTPSLGAEVDHRSVLICHNERSARKIALNLVI